MNGGFRFAFGRSPAIAAEAMVATSHAAAARAGVRMLERGGNAVDAALAAAAALCVVEPMSTGIGGDAFAVVWRDGQAEGLDAAGPAPTCAEPSAPVDEAGPRSVTVPGAVAGWDALARRYGRFGLDVCLVDAIDFAERGIALTPRTAAAWIAERPCPAGFGPVAPMVGERIRLPDLATTMRRLAGEGPSALYQGSLGRAITEVTWLDEADLAAYRPRWVEPLRHPYRGIEVLELPPPTQGVAVLEGLALLEGMRPSLVSQVECVRLALEDAFAHVRDRADVTWLLDPGYVKSRRRDAAPMLVEPAGGTVYLCAVDSDRLAVSLVQSLYRSFGSGIVAPGTGIVLQNRAACFALHGGVEPGRRPYHTIIPGLLVRDGQLAGPFGVVGGFLQAQAHIQLVSALIDDGLDPQAALDRSRFRVEADCVKVEEGLWPRSDELVCLGHSVVRDASPIDFGAGQVILVQEQGALVGGTDPRTDGAVAGI